jgi:hypothetical protein
MVSSSALLLRRREDLVSYLAIKGIQVKDMRLR